MESIRGLGVIVATLALAMPCVARADTSKVECIDANRKGQDLRREGKFGPAREQLVKCADAACPAVVRDDCTSRIDELDRAQPTLVFEVKDAGGKDVSAVEVLIDGRPWLDHLTPTAVAVEPGNHTFRFQRPGAEPVEVKLFVREGEKARHESVVIGGEVAAAAPKNAASGSSKKTIGLFVGGVGLAGLVVGGVFGGIASADWSSSKNECSTPVSCTNHQQAISDHDSAITTATVSTIGFIAGGVALATGAVLYWTARSDERSALTAGVVMTPGGMLVRGTF